MVNAAIFNLSLYASSTFWQHMVALELRLATRLTRLRFSISAQDRLATKRHNWFCFNIEKVENEEVGG